MENANTIARYLEVRSPHFEVLVGLRPVEGHAQREHDTRHGSMSQTRWAVDGPEGTSLELNGRKFASNDDGAPMMCNLVCQDMGRHVHIDYCRTQPDDPCGDKEIEHITALLQPDPDMPKDYITHKLHWLRSGMPTVSS